MKYSILLLVLFISVIFMTSWCCVQISDMFVIRKTDAISEHKK